VVEVSAMVARWWEKPARRSPAVFVSHASADSRQVAVVVDVLEGAGLPCWVAPRDIRPGSEWAGAIVDGIERSKGFVVVLSGHACASREVPREVELASRAHKPMLTLRIDRDAVLNGPLQFFLSSIHWFDATGRPLRQQLDDLPAKVAEILRMAVPPRPVTAVKERVAVDRDEVGPDLDDLLRRGPGPAQRRSTR
jgi:hypothetical protein